VAFDPVIVEYLVRRYYKPRAIEMRACHPRDLLNHVLDLASYENREVRITRELLDAACHSYFTEEPVRRAPAPARRREPETENQDSSA
jgi:hypothetical protein